MLQMHVFNLDCVNMHDNNDKDMWALDMIAVFQTVFQNGGGNLCRPITCSLHQMLVDAISDTATAKATVSTKTGMSFSGQAT